MLAQLQRQREPDNSAADDDYVPRLHRIILEREGKGRCGRDDALTNGRIYWTVRRRELLCVETPPAEFPSAEVPSEGDSRENTTKRSGAGPM